MLYVILTLTSVRLSSACWCFFRHFKCIVLHGDFALLYL